MATVNETGGDQSGITRNRRVLSKPVPTDRLVIDKQVELLRAFAAVYESNGGKPVSNEAAGAAVTPPKAPATVMMTNAFFVDVGLLTRADDGGFIPSGPVLEYNKALQWDRRMAEAKIQPAIQAMWFYRCLAPRLQLSPQTKKSCLGVLAYESDATPEQEERLNNLLEFLSYFSLVRVTGDTISLGSTTIAIDTGYPQEKKISQDPPDDRDQHTLFLDSSRRRRFVVQAPLTISEAEYERICAWLKVVLIVEGEAERLIKNLAGVGNQPTH